MYHASDIEQPPAAARSDTATWSREPRCTSVPFTRMHVSNVRWGPNNRNRVPPERPSLCVSPPDLLARAIESGPREAQTPSSDLISRTFLLPTSAPAPRAPHRVAGTAKWKQQMRAFLLTHDRQQTRCGAAEFVRSGPGGFLQDGGSCTTHGRCMNGRWGRGGSTTHLPSRLFVCLAVGVGVLFLHGHVGWDPRPPTRVQTTGPNPPNLPGNS